MAENIREIALDSLIEIMEHGQMCHVVTGETLKKYQYLDKKDRAFYSRLVQGTIENAIYIDYVIDTFSKTKVVKMKPFIRSLLRMSVYQIKYMDNVPDSAACNESVKLAIKRGFKGLRGFVNGVLRNISRQIESVKLPDKEKDLSLYLSVKYSMPQWIVQMWLDEYGENDTTFMLESFLTRHNITIRSLVGKGKEADLVKNLKEDGASVEPANYLKEAFILTKFDHISSLKAFKEGKIYVQDESSMLVAHAAGIKKDDYIIDVCAAPGGKCLHAAMLLDNTGFVDARDLTLDKVEKINENIKRCGYDNIKAKVWDALKKDEDIVGKGDIVLADLPCSGLGVIGQKADIKYKTSREDIRELATIQRNILSVVKEYVKPGGVLIYSTCTVNEEENLNNALWLNDDENFSLESLDEFIPDSLHNEDTKKGYLKLIPGKYDCDGFFIARFRRKG